MFQKVLDDKANIREDFIFRPDDNAWIPCNPMNKDYQDYLKWKDKEGNPKNIADLPEKVN